MKKLIILTALLATGYVTKAQQVKKQKHMVITIQNENTITIGKGPNNMFITRDDTAQIQKRINLNPHMKLKDQAAGFEALLMNVIEPYYAQGWKLVSTSVDDATFNQITTQTLRYYFVKDTNS